MALRAAVFFAAAFAGDLVGLAPAAFFFTADRVLAVFFFAVPDFSPIVPYPFRMTR